ncbi:HAD family hydrolase [Paenibacillus sp. MMS20-IR301]|uniref:HAD family hydrolase n=1 Tax=Paenibacillus sp. MMS20-IR301 TaxID=2895946 RepID=UPI0028EE76E7|nr:HAD family hydrolase [Paenibacillus sp. MMS20-IR301]WNS46410.1 HAD hydrolase-like protein [Paenibacillus sp. MMS20-IR301]
MSNEGHTPAANGQLPQLNKPEAIVFDMDGTLFQTESLLLPAYHKMFDILREEGLHAGPTPPEELILGSLGMLLAQIWKNVMPEASEEVHRRADDLLLQLEIEGLEAGGTILYPKVAETLAALHSRGVRLFVASNGLADYIHSIVVVHELKDLFEGLYSAGGQGTATKTELLRLLLDNHNISSAWMVGDRSSDVEAGKGNGQTVIGCAYAGFGRQDELKGSDVIISAFDELISLYDNSAATDLK